MRFVCFVFLTVFCLISCMPALASKCGCKTLTTCYMSMLDLLHEQDEAYCIEDASIGTSSLTILLHALKEFCGDVVTVETVAATFDNRNLYEVVVQYVKKEENKGDELQETDKKGKGKQKEEDKPTIIIDAGQEGGVEAVKFALFILEQIVACQENKEMIENVKWVFMPSTNPDGLEFSRYRNSDWRKNLKVHADEVSFGVDVSRNFDVGWDSCPKVYTGFAGDYPGPIAASEKETKFINNVITKHKGNAKIYVTIRRDGHHIAFPHAHTSKSTPNKTLEQLQMIAGEVANKVNLRSGGVHTFKNDSIYNLEGKKRCGHSVDWVYVNGIDWAFEMRVFPEKDNEIMSMFQNMPRGYDNTLRNGYFNGIRELYSVLTNKKKYGKLAGNKKL